MAVSPTTPTVLPTGTWRVDPSSSKLGFRARGMFGLVPVKGAFGSYTGELTIDADGGRGELRIDAATLDTGNQKRDTHLRSADFFEVDKHPTVVFTLTNLSPESATEALITGVLRIRGATLPITNPVTVSLHGDHLHLNTEISVDRAAAGVGWSKMGMIQGKAHLHASLVLTREAQ